MSQFSRGIRAAEMLLAQVSDKSPPIDVITIAKQYAYIRRDTLPSDVSGMLVPSHPDSKKRWIIVINRVQSSTRQRFTVAHELGHIVLHQYDTPHADGPPIVHFRDDQSSLGTNKEEIEANQFAAELLLPAQILVPRLREAKLDSWAGAQVESESSSVRDRIGYLAEQFKVSEEAMMLRIGTLMQRG